jgi:hypothetical protein
MGIAAGVGLGAAAYSVSTVFTHSSLEAAGINALALGVYTVPNSMMLLGLYQQNPDRVTLWRRTAAVAQTGMAAVAAGTGVYALAADDGWGDLVGAVFLLASVPMFATAAMHYSPFSVER